jgi:hypothetical protein
VLVDQRRELRSPLDRIEASGALSIHGDDPIPGLEPAGGRQVGLDPPDLAGRLLDAEREREQDHERDQEVHHRPGGDHHDPLPDRLVVVGARRDLGR